MSDAYVNDYEEAYAEPAELLDREWLRVVEAKYADLADAHKERGEWEAARRAAQVSDHIRFYRLHREALDAGRVKPDA